MANQKTEEILTVYSTKLNVKALETDLEAIKIQCKCDGLTIENVSVILLAVMEAVNKYKKLSGHEKKTLVIKIMRHFIYEICPDDRSDLERILQQMVPTLIDGIIHVGKMNTFRKRIIRCIC